MPQCKSASFGVAWMLLTLVLSSSATLDAQVRARRGPLARGETAPEARGVIDLPRLSGPVILDGRSDEPAWEGIEPVPLTMYQPTFRGCSNRRIELLIAYDDEALYAAGRFLHDDRRNIRAFSLTRDRYGGDDGFALILDTFNDNENAVRFTGLPLGARMDHSIEGDGQEVRLFLQRVIKRQGTIQHILQGIHPDALHRWRRRVPGLQTPDHGGHVSWRHRPGRKMPLQLFTHTAMGALESAIVWLNPRRDIASRTEIRGIVAVKNAD